MGSMHGVRIERRVTFHISFYDRIKQDGLRYFDANRVYLIGRAISLNSSELSR